MEQGEGVTSGMKAGDGPASVTPLLSALGGVIVLVHAVFSFKLRLKR